MFQGGNLGPVCLIYTIPNYQREIEKTAIQVRIEAIRKKIGKLAESIKISEQEKDEDKIKTYQEEFTKLSKLLTTS